MMIARPIQIARKKMLAFVFPEVCLAKGLRRVFTADVVWMPIVTTVKKVSVFLFQIHVRTAMRDFIVCIKIANVGSIKTVKVEWSIARRGKREPLVSRSVPQLEGLRLTFPFFSLTRRGRRQIRFRLPNRQILVLDRRLQYRPEARHWLQPRLQNFQFS